MKSFKILLFFFAAVCASALAQTPSKTTENFSAPFAPLPGSELGETPALRTQVQGTILTDAPVGGIERINLPSLSRTALRASDSKLGAVILLSELDAQNAVVFVTPSSTEKRHFDVRHIAQGKETILFSAAGEPLWDRPISAMSLSSHEGRIAFAAQKGTVPEPYSQWVVGTLQIWDPRTRARQDTHLDALAQRPAWLADEQRVIYAAPGSPSSDSTQAAPQVRVFDLKTGTDTALTRGERPIISSDMRSLLVARGKPAELFLFDLDSGHVKPIPSPSDLTKPVGLIKSRYLLYMGKTTPGAAEALTTHTSRVPPRPMLSLKLVDIETGQFTSVLALIDPRTEVTVR